MSNKPTCGAKHWETPCTPETCEWFINAPQYFNCFLIYRHYIQDCEHTLQEVAALMNMSHTTVKMVQETALNKIRLLIQNGEISVDALKLLLKGKQIEE